ncbi:MAG: TetR/AcrR family transcriptional regulator [Thermoleophilia bacterium]|nr:TetR/AcrR family transcriptional regulator [Thermoleophilia bacterium]
MSRTAGEVAASGSDYFAREGLRIGAALERGVNWNSMLTFLRVSAGSRDPEVASAAKDLYVCITAGPQSDLTEAIEGDVAREVDIELATDMMAGMTEALAWRGRQDDSYDGATLGAFLEDMLERTVRVRGDEDQILAQVAAMVQGSEQAEHAIEVALPVDFGPNQATGTRQKIVDAAVDLLHKTGYDHLRVEDITAHAGVGKGTFYHHFTSKQDVLLAFFARVMKNMQTVEERVAAADLDYLCKVALRMRMALEYHRHWERIVTFIRVMAGSGDPRIAAAARETFGRLTEAPIRDHEKAMHKGLVRRVDAQLACTAVIGMEEVLVWRTKQDCTRDPAAVLAFMADMFCRGFLAD